MAKIWKFARLPFSCTHRTLRRPSCGLMEVGTNARDNSSKTVAIVCFSKWPTPFRETTRLCKPATQGSRSSWGLRKSQYLPIRLCQLSQRSCRVMKWAVAFRFWNWLKLV